jgi:nitroreductase
MEFSTVVRRRRMVRNYDPDRPVPAEVVDRLLDHAVRAPSAGFSQGWAFLVLEEAVDRERFWAATSPAADRSDPAADRSDPAAGRGDPAKAVASRWLTGMRRAPLIVVPHANRSAYLDRYAEPDKGWTDRAEKRWPVPYWYVDSGFAALLMLLTAVDEGLGACFFGIPPERTGSFRDEFGVPGEFMPIGALTIGYPAPDHRSPSLRRGRRPVEQVVHRGRWS